MALALLIVGLPALATVGPAAAGAPSLEPAPPLDRLSITIGDLKASLSGIRQDLEALRGASSDLSAADQLCAAPLTAERAERDAAAQALERLRTEIEAERAEQRRNEAAASAELASLRQRLTEAGADSARLYGERATLVRRIADLEGALRQARTSEVVAALVRRPQTSPIESAAAAEFEVVASPVEPARTAGAIAVHAPSGAAAGADIQLRAELALAQLKIADLTAELRSAHAGREAVEAEVRSLRSLTDARIKSFMGWQ